MSKYTTKQLVDLLRKGDPLSHKILKVIADRLESSHREHAHRLDEVRELQEKIMWFLECWEMKPPQDAGAYKEAEQTLIASVDALADKVEGRSPLVLDDEHDVDIFVENIFRPALVVTLKAENHRLRRGLEEIVSTAESDPENQYDMNSYAAGYSGGLEEQAQRAREALLEKDSHTQPSY
jgi:hypothetical protein